MIERELLSPKWFPFCQKKENRTYQVGLLNVSFLENSGDLFHLAV